MMRVPARVRLARKKVRRVGVEDDDGATHRDCHHPQPYEEDRVEDDDGPQGPDEDDDGATHRDRMENWRELLPLFKIPPDYSSVALLFFILLYRYGSVYNSDCLTRM